MERQYKYSKEYFFGHASTLPQPNCNAARFVTALVCGMLEEMLRKGCRMSISIKDATHSLPISYPFLINSPTYSPPITLVPHPFHILPAYFPHSFCTLSAPFPLGTMQTTSGTCRKVAFSWTPLSTSFAHLFLSEAPRFGSVRPLFPHPFLNLSHPHCCCRHDGCGKNVKCAERMWKCCVFTTPLFNKQVSSILHIFLKVWATSIIHILQM